MISVVAYHALLPFSTIPWWISNDERVDWLSTPLLMSETVVLGVLFVIAGGAAHASLLRRDGGQFLSERARRLIVPFVVGTVLLSPPTAYLASVFGARGMSFPAFLADLPGAVASWATTVGFSPRLLTIGFHLWFLAWLFLYSLLAPVLVGWMRSPRGRRALDRLASLLGSRGSTLGLAIPTIVLPTILVAADPQQYGWWQFCWLAMYFALGCVLLGDGRLRSAVERDAAPAAIAASVGLLVLQLGDLGGLVNEVEAYGFEYEAANVAMVGLAGLTAWAAVLATIGLALRWRRLDRPLPGALAGMVLPIYVVHFPIVIGLSVAVVGAPLALAAKGAAAVVGGLSASAAAAIILRRMPLRDRTKWLRR